MEERIITEENSAPATEAAAVAPATEKMPMAWHKFQKNCLLWIIALFYIARAFLIASGNIYYEASIRAAIYAGMPLLRVLDYVFAAHCVSMAVCGIISAVRLSKGSARLLMKLNFIMAIGETAYLLLRWAVSGLPPINFQCAGLIIAHVLLWRVNRVYYLKRSEYLERKEKS